MQLETQPARLVERPSRTPVAPQSSKLSQIFLTALQKLWTPPPRQTVSEWADLSRMLSSESSAEPGRWRTDKAPYQRAIMDAQSDPNIAEVVVMKSSQVGWTEILNNTIGFYIAREPAPILLVQPTLEMAEAWSKDRFAPMIRDTPELSELVADPKSRGSGNTLLHKAFRGGHLTVVGANAPTALASRPIRFVMFDEVDRFPASAGTEGDPISLARRRAATFANRKVLMGSTPTIKGSSRIEAAFDESDQRYYMVPCPHCRETQRLIWSQVHWPDTQPERAVYVCQHCGVELTDADKPEMLRAGEWEATRPFAGIAGFHISELYSPWSTWGEMAVAFLRAKKFPETLQTWINTALGETWEQKGDTLEPTGLMARREPYSAQQLPAGVLLVTAGVDTQDNRLEAFLYGWGDQEEAWHLETKVFRGDPGGAEVWAELDAWLKIARRTDDGRTLLVEAACVDSGGSFTQHVYRYCNARKRFRIWAIKGAAGSGRLAWPKYATRVRTTAGELFIIGVDTIKSVLYGRLQRVTEPGPGYVHFSAECDDGFFAQLTSETRLYKTIQGRRVSFWKPKSANARQEALDGTVYAYAAMIGRGGAELLAVRASNVIAEQVDDDHEPPHTPPQMPHAAQQRPMRPRGNYVKRGRF
jgi:phage terminase large subunit GpA-like protein